MFKIKEKLWFDIICKKQLSKMENFVLKENESFEIFPSLEKMLECFNFFPPSETKVVILGQDPYHGNGQANGLSFSVNKNIKIPPSLKNIFKEINLNFSQTLEMKNSDMYNKKNINSKKAINNNKYSNFSSPNFSSPNFSNGDLTKWAEQGVLLLNSVLSVRKNEPGSHFNKGWENLTNNIIKSLSNNHQNIVFMLWGKKSQEKEYLINKEKHLVLKAAHPSPFAAYRGFFGCQHFSKANEYLRNNNFKEINWILGKYLN